MTAEATVFCSQPEDMVEFAYDHNGLRVQKKVTGADGTSTTTDYMLHGKRVTHQTVKKVAADGTATTREMHFYSDAQSRPAMVEYGGAMYTYLHNLQGDIIGIVDSAGSLVVRYGYDAWGKPTEVWSEDDPALESSLKTAYEKLAALNPFRYRGYVWDTETGLYFLRSRYYAPVWGRFINVDRVIAPPGNLSNRNSFGYCDSNPDAFFDPKGNFKISAQDLVNDWAGRKILWWYLFGKGKDRTITNNWRWTNYMKGSKLCQCGGCGTYPKNTTLSKYTYDLVKPYAADLEEGESITMPTQNLKVALENGEGIVGYNYLHGVSLDTGKGLYGYQVDATISKHCGYVKYEITCTWYDVMDPNFAYSTDRDKAEFAQKIPFADPQDYKIVITWEDTFIDNINGVGCLPY